MDENRTLRMADRPEPAEGKDNMIVRVRSASICGTDMRTFLHGNAKITPPRILGHEFAGDVVYTSAYAEEHGLRVGDRVSHRTFGEGCILTATPMGNDTLLEIAFEQVGTKKLMANFARLTKLSGNQ